MEYKQYNNVDDFLKRMITTFEENELFYGMMYGICLQLKKDLFIYGEQPLLAVVEDNNVVYLGALMTPPYNLQLCVPKIFSEGSLEILSHGLLENGWIVPGVRAEKDLAESFTKKWKTIKGCKYRKGMEQLLHKLRHVNSIDYSHGELRQANSNDLDRAIDWVQGFHLDCFGMVEPDRSTYTAKQTVSSGRLFFWEETEPVSMAARTRPTPHGESIALMYTPSEKRRKGYATSVVASLSQRILDDGKQFCSLYTDIDNPTSNSIYQKIGYTPVGDVIDIQFEYR